MWLNFAFNQREVFCGIPLLIWLRVAAIGATILTIADYQVVVAKDNTAHKIIQAIFGTAYLGWLAYGFYI